MREGIDTWTDAKFCLKCRGPLTFELIGNYGDLYNISIKTGKISRTRKKRIHYEHSRDAMIYCSSCGTNYDYQVKSNRTCEIKLSVNEE